MNIKEKLKDIVVKSLDEFVENEIREWPPGCLGILCQPERPNDKENK